MSDSEIMLFTNEQFGEVRSLLINGEPWFVGKDVAAALGYERATKAIADHVDSEDRDEVPIRDSIGRMQKTPVINESGVYSLILQSKLPSARAFKRWVVADILPALRKHGVYATPDALEKALLSPEFAIRVFTELKTEREKRVNAEKEKDTLVEENAVLAAKNSALKEENLEMRPKASYYDKILRSNSCVPVTQIAKDYGMGGAAFNQLLYSYGIQYPLRETWLLYAEYADKGYTQSKTFVICENRVKVHTYWTQKGRFFLYDFLKKQGLVPLCERDGFYD